MRKLIVRKISSRIFMAVEVLEVLAIKKEIREVNKIIR